LSNRLFPVFKRSLSAIILGLDIASLIAVQVARSKGIATAAVLDIAINKIVKIRLLM
jgi:hypothetical protein